MASSLPSLTSSSPSLKGITPLLDVLFILLFALLALSESKSSPSEELFRVQLPQVEADANPAVVDLEKLVISLDVNSRIRVQGMEGAVNTLEEFDSLLASALGDALPENIAIEIQGDQLARHGVTIGLLQHLRLRGFQNVMFLVAGGNPSSFLEAQE